MAMANSLGFDLLDRHVVDGNGDDMACRDATGSLSFAQLLSRAAALAGGLTAMGVSQGKVVDIELPAGNARVIAVCAAVRLGALPGLDADVVIGLIDDRPHARAGEDSVDLDLLERAGRSDPAPALKVDDDGYRSAVEKSFGDIVEPLLSGSPVV